MWFHDPIDPSEGKAATFVFRYRPRGVYPSSQPVRSVLTGSSTPDLLQAQGIMPLDRPKSVEAEPSTVKKEMKRPGSPSQRHAKRHHGESTSAPGSGSGSRSAKRDLGVVEVLSDDDEDYDVLKVRPVLDLCYMALQLCSGLMFAVILRVAFENCKTNSTRPHARSLAA